MERLEKENRELRRLLRDLVALATTPAGWVGRERAQIAESVADVLLHTLRADAVYVCLQSPHPVEVVRSPQHHGFGDEVRRVWPKSAGSLAVETITASKWLTPLKVAVQPIGISGDDGFIAVGCSGSQFPNEAESLLLSLAANQTAVALQTARLRTEADLERHRLRDVIAQAPAAIGLLTGPEHRWVYVNHNYVRVTGRTSVSDFVGKTLRESLPEIENQPFLQILDDVYRTGKPYVGREMKAMLNRAHSGQSEEAYFDFVYQPVLNAEEIVDGILVHAVEVTDKVTARLAIEQSERRFREMIDALPAAIYTTDAEGRLTHFNPAAVEFAGRTPELGRDQWCVSWKLYYPDGRPMLHEECPMAIALKEGRIIKGAEAIAESPDGTRRWFTPYPTPLRNDQGKIVGGINMLVDITARRQAEEATAHLAAIVSSSDDAIVSKDLHGFIRSWNASAERLFGFTHQEAIGKHITLIVPPDRHSEEDKILSRLRRGERIEHFETVRMRKDGSTFDVSLTISPIRNSSGQVVGASKVARDISHLKRIEHALRESEERFRAIVDTTPECVKLVDQDGTVLHMNSSGLGMVGADSPAQVVGKSIYDLIAPEDRERFRDFNHAICGGDRGNLSFDIVRLDGERRHMETQAAPLRNPDSTVVQLAVTRDITDRKRAQELLRQSEERLRALVNATAYVVYRMSPDWSEMRQLDGCGFISDIAKPTKDWLQEYVHIDDQRLVQDAIQKAIQSKSVFELEHRVRRVDGSLGWTVSRAVPILDKDGEITEWFGAATDVTARKVAEENFRKLAETLDAEVRVRTRELEERNSEVLRQSEQVRELSWRLLRTQDEERRHIARELHDSAGQTLVVLGMNVAGLVEKAARTAPEIAAEAETIQQTVQQLHRDIRTASYLLHPPLLDESGLYSAVSWYTQGLAERSGLQIELDMTRKFGRLPGDMELVVFRLVQECLTNIHRHSGSKSAWIKIAREARQILVEVKDSGHGMSPQRLAAIQSGGAGTGIRGMRERLRQFAGKMEIYSDEEGTRICVAIPVSKTEKQDDNIAPESLHVAS